MPLHRPALLLHLPLDPALECLGVGGAIVELAQPRLAAGHLLLANNACWRKYSWDGPLPSSGPGAGTGSGSAGVMVEEGASAALATMALPRNRLGGCAGPPEVGGAAVSSAGKPDEGCSALLPPPKAGVSTTEVAVGAVEEVGAPPSRGQPPPRTRRTPRLRHPAKDGKPFPRRGEGKARRTIRKGRAGTAARPDRWSLFLRTQVRYTTKPGRALSLPTVPSFKCPFRCFAAPLDFLYLHVKTPSPQVGELKPENSEWVEYAIPKR